MADSRLTASQKRRQYIVTGFQSGFLITVLVWVAALVALVAAGIIVPALWPVLTATSDAIDPSVGTALLVIHERIWWPLLGFFFALTTVLVRETHRIAGPLYRFRQVFKRVGTGDIARGVSVRERDYLQKEAEEFDAMISGLRQLATEMKTAVDQTATALDALDRAEPSSSPQREALRRAVERTRAATSAFRTEPEPITSEPAQQTSRTEGGFSLIELLIAVAIISVIAAIGGPAYASALTRARVAHAVGDINAMGKEAMMFRVSRGCFPAALADIGYASGTDPWGEPYVYVVPDFKPSGGGGGRGGGGSSGPSTGSCGACGGACVPIGQARKDKNLVPINFDFDLYSKGPDKQTATPIGATISLDDIVRGRSGGFIGLARDY